MHNIIEGHFRERELILTFTFLNEITEQVVLNEVLELQIPV